MDENSLTFVAEESRKINPNSTLGDLENGIRQEYQNWLSDSIWPETENVYADSPLHSFYDETYDIWWEGTINEESYRMFTEFDEMEIVY